MDVKEIIDKIRQSIDTSTQKEHDDIIGSTISITLLNGSERTNIEFPAKFLFLSSFTREGEKIPGPVVLGYYDEEVCIIAGEVDMTAIISQIPIEQMESCILKLHFENHDYYTSYHIYSLTAYDLDYGDLTPSTESIDIPLKKIYDEYGRWGFGIYPFDWGSYAEVNGATLDITLMTLTSIAVTKNPNKITYTVGETFDKAGMVVTAYYSNGTSKTITDYTYSPSGKLTLNDTAIIISYEGKTATLPIFVLGEININETDKRYLYFKDRQFIDANAGENLCKIDARSGILHLSRGLLSFGGKKLPLNLSLVYDFQHRNENTIYGRETGFPKGFRTNYHQTCVPKDGKYYYTDGGAYLHVYKKAMNTDEIWVDTQGSGLLLTKESNGDVKIFDEFGNFSLFDGYGRLYLIHQKFTSSSSAELKISYDGISEKITSIVDGMGRETTFRYETYNLWISVNGSEKIWISMYANLTIGSVHREDNKESERDNYLTNDAGKLYQITSASGERLKLEYKDDEVIEYYSNFQEKTYKFKYERDNLKTTVIDNKGVEQVITFNEEDIVTGTYQAENSKEYNVYYVDKDACATFSSALATEPLIKFYYYDTSEYIKLPAGKSESSNKEFLSRVPNTKFSVFSVKMEATGNERNKSGKITAELITGDNTILCSLQFNPSIEGLQIAAKPFTANADASVRVKLKVDCDYGEFKFTDSVILPMLGSVEKLCSNINIDEGGFSYLHNDYDNNYRVFFLNGGTGVKIDGKEYDFKLYTEDYLANARNIHKNVIDGGFVFWYNNKRGCYVGTKSATVKYGDEQSITFDTSGIHSGDFGIKLYSLSSGPNGISTLNSLNYDSKSFPNVYNGYYLQDDTIITNGDNYTVNSAYYDENLNLCIEQQRENPNTITQQTTYTLDSSGNVTAVKTTAGNNNILNEYAYDSKGYQISATNYIGSLKSQSKYSYDLFGNILSNTEPNSFLTNYGYDTFGDRLTELNAKIQTQETRNSISYMNATVNSMSGNGGSTYSFEYYDNSNLKTVKINYTIYVELSYNYTDNEDTITKNYGNIYTEIDILNKFGNTIYKKNGSGTYEYTYATYFYGDDRDAAYNASSPTESSLAVSSASKLYKVIDNTISATTLYDYNEYNQVTKIETMFARLPDLNCELKYDDNQRLEQETYTYGGDTVERISYSYRSNLNYSNDVEKTYTFANGISLSVQKEWDALNRVTYITTQSETTNNGMQYDIKYLPRTVNGTGTTNFISDWTYYQNINNSLSGFRVDTFEYDINGNITKYTIYEVVNKYEIEYVYDSANRLIRENNQKFNKTFLYAYDSNGNIIAKQGYPYTTGKLSAPTQNYFYDYDRLIKCQGLEFAYDDCGNPFIYKGQRMKWSKRFLSSYRGYSFTYNANGERVEKTSGTGTTKYSVINGKMIREERPNGTVITYLYGSTGIIGCLINGTHYYYVKNLFGDVVQIRRTSDNAVVAKYYYDAWGECAVENYTSDYVGNINPIRYRSYYWDDDVKFYYLHTRWYDPNIGRFLNLDQIEYLDPETINGLNLYAYCLNNPVMGIDPMGTTAWWGWALLGLAVVGIAVAAVVATVATGGLAVVAGAVAIGGAIGLAGETISQVSENGWENVDWGQVAFNGLAGMAVAGTMVSPLSPVATGFAIGTLGFAQAVGNDLFDNGGDWGRVDWGKDVAEGALMGVVSGAGKYLMNLGNGLGAKYDPFIQDSFPTIKAFVFLGKIFATISKLGAAGLRFIVKKIFD